MKATEFNRDEVLKDFRRLLNNTKKRINRIRGEGLTDAPIYANEQLKNLKDRLPKRLSDLTDKELQTAYRDIRYINQLKSATLRGAREVEANFEPIRKKLNSFSKNTQEKIWRMYGKFYGEVGSTAEYFKYELLETNIDMLEEITDEDEIVGKLEELFRKSYTQGSENSERLKVLFTEELNKLRK